MVVQRDDRATLLNIPDLDDSIPSANASDRDGEGVVSSSLKSPTCQHVCHAAVCEQSLLFNQTFQIFILWHPTTPIDRMIDIVAAGPALQTDDLNRPTTPDTRLHKSAMAGEGASIHKFLHFLRLVFDIKHFDVNKSTKRTVD